MTKSDVQEWTERLPVQENGATLRTRKEKLYIVFYVASGF